MNRLFLTLFCFGAPLIGSGSEGIVFFEKHIRPALIEHCYSCHSEGEKVKGGLLLDRKQGWEIGGDSGPAIVPQDLEASLVIDAIRYGDPDTEMPPKGKLPDDLIAKFEEWVQMGAPDPRTEPTSGLQSEGINIERGKEFWSFRPVTKPEMADGEGQLEAIDQFIEVTLAKKGLSPAKQTSHEQRLRRAKTDITGLLPTVAEQNEYLAAPTDETFAKLIDRWMASSAFGERWGRHWLDLARYSDTSGGGRAMPLPEAWRFRDFVISAFNQNMPLDDLIRMHIAGDLLPWGEDYEQRTRNLIATGFLVLGPHNYENQNKALLDLEIADEQVDTVGRAFLGMTIGCARCHDHKFDPVPTADYYSLAGIFLSTDSVTHSNVSKWHTEPISPTREQQLARDEFLVKARELVAAVAEKKKVLAKLGRGTGGKDKSVVKDVLPGIVIDDVDAEKVGEWQSSSHTARFVDAGYIHDMQMMPGEKQVIYRHQFEVAGKYELRVSYASSSNRNPKVPVIVQLPGDEIQTHYLNQKLRPEHDNLYQTIENYTFEIGQEVSVTISNNTDQEGVVIADSIQFYPQSEVVEVATEVKSDPKSKKEIARLEVELRQLELKLKKLRAEEPKIPSAMCAVDLAANEVRDTEIRIRGVEDNLGPIAKRGFLQVASWEPASIPDGESGRVQLANWIVDPRNPLTSRVLANRIWKQLIGKGIVTSPDNFGVTGNLPTHPELLDYLASQLVESGWSPKALIREIMLSRVYSRTAESKQGESIDPLNETLWRAHSRFLDAEVLRDGMLQVSGSLDYESGGPALPKGFKSEYGFQCHSAKRSVYVPIFRNTGHPLFNLFDFANPNFTVGQRSGSTIPTQALFLTNSPFVHQQADLAARLVLEHEGSIEEKIERVYREILGRKPNAEEAQLTVDFMSSNESDASAWASLIRSLFACVDYRILR